jgi:outer membrane protein OmpA-like peptidoglycan-associated protein
MLFDARRLVTLSGLSAVLFATSVSQGNICGTAYQSFNPMTGGLDFVTVHSSETLQPCTVNLGFFTNYSIKTLTYTRDYTDGTGRVYRAGNKPDDKIWGADLSAGFGLQKNWDVGVNVPFVLDQDLSDPTLSSNYKSKGATEIKLNTKYKFSGDEQGGFAAVASVNQNLIKNNPFEGENSGPTLNLELVADTTIDKWSMAVNVGHRWRNPGSQIAGVPFQPLGNQLIYSGAASYYLTSVDTKVIAEVFGGQSIETNNSGSQRSPNSLEWQLGVKHDIQDNLALHVGGGTQLFNSLGSPEARIYAGINWVLGAPCAETASLEVVPPKPVTAVATPKRKESMRLNAAILFATNSADLRAKDIPDLDDYFAKTDVAKIQRLRIEGHTDSRGNAVYNLELSERRAKTVMAYIARKFSLPVSKIEPIGFGEENPVADNGNLQGRQKNRRVEFQIDFLD